MAPAIRFLFDPEEVIWGDIEPLAEEDDLGIVELRLAVSPMAFRAILKFSPTRFAISMLKL